jgi:glycerol-3-phosphate acyltransferase PlsY
MDSLYAAGIGYLLGSIPTSLLAGRWLRGIDIREHGSGNPGASNTLRVMGWRPALAVLAVDVAKGWIAVTLASRLLASGGVPSANAIGLAAGAGALAGHLWPVWASFRGGKGVATAAGVILAWSPWVCLACVAVFVALLAATRRISVGSVGAAVLSPALAWALGTLGAAPPGWPLLPFTLLLAVAIPWTHRSNLARLRRGSEPRVGQGDDGGEN